MGFPAARPANQATRQAERQAGSLSVSVESSASYLPLSSCTEQRTQEDNAADVNSDPGSPLFSGIFLSHSLSSSLLPRLSSLLLVYSPQFVNRSLLM